MDIINQLGTSLLSNKVFLAVFTSNGEYGTCFTVEVDGKQYLITAKHLAEKVQWARSGYTNIPLMYKGEWTNFPISLIGHCDGDVDISVMVSALPIGVSIVPSNLSLPLLPGQDVYFFGYPYPGEINSAIEMRNFDFPVPFIKKGIISFIAKGGRLYIDGHNNPGFSGGPVMFRDMFTQPQPPLNLIHSIGIAGVISGCKGETKPVKLCDKTVMPHGGHIEENAGIAVAYSIKFAVEVINSNPRGLPVKQ